MEKDTFNPSSLFGKTVQAVRSGKTAVDEAAKELLSALTEDEKLWLLSGDIPFWQGMRGFLEEGYNLVPYVMGAVERVGIPGIRFIDGPRGVVAGQATAFPVSMARGATWDPELEERIGGAIGLELREAGGNFFGGVCVNLPWYPGWGRSQETYSDQPLLLGRMGAGLSRGIQRNAIACVKHYALNSMENGRFSVDVTVDDELLHEVFLRHFEMIVRSGCLAVMGAYNSLNGEWAGQNEHTLREILREEWGFEGVTITDFIWGHRDPVKAIKAGMDVEAPFYQQRLLPVLHQAITDGALSWDAVEEAGIHTLTAQLSIYATRQEEEPEGTILSKEHLDLARETAARSFVLLKNDQVDARPLLPLPEGLASLAVIGRFSDAANTGDHGSSHVRSPKVVSVLEGLTEALPGTDVRHDDGANLDEARRIAAESEAVVLVVGNGAGDEGEFLDGSLAGRPELTATYPEPRAEEFEDVEYVTSKLAPGKSFLANDDAAGGDRADLHLRSADVELIRAVTEVNPRTVVLMVHAGAVLVDPWCETAPAIASIWYSGAEGGNAVADVLLGKHNFDGRMPYPVPMSQADVPELDINADSVTYTREYGQRLIAARHSSARYPLGYGLSYTNYTVRSAQLASQSEQTFTLEVTVSNDGTMDGHHVVQAYGDDATGFAELLGFASVFVSAGTSKKVDLTCDLRGLATWNAQAKEYTYPSGAVAVSVGTYWGDPAALRVDVNL